MYCDALTLAAVVQEMRDKLLGGRIQQVLLLQHLAIGLEVYARHQRHYLLISAQPEEGGRIHLVGDKLRRGPDTLSPLALRLRKQVQAAHLTEIQQPRAERLVQLTLEGDEGVVVLVAEIMGRRSNILLLDEDGTILECVRHVPASQNRYRVLLPGYPYVPPPAQQKANVAALTPAGLEQLMHEQGAGLPLWKKLVASLRGVSPLLAREVVFRVSGDVQVEGADASSIWAELGELLRLSETGQWQPTVAVEQEQIVAYAPYVLTQYAHCESKESISEAMTAYYAQEARADSYAVSRSRVQKLIEQQRERQSHRRDALRRAQPSDRSLDELRTKGELLLAYAQQGSPGQEELVVQLGENEAAVHIALQASKSPIENAQEYFRRYEKAKGAAQGVPLVLAEVEAELAYLDQLSTDLTLAEDQPGIAAVEYALAEAGYLPQPKKRARPPKAMPLIFSSPEGFSILVGRNSWQNEEVTFHHSQGHDVWLHSRGLPGAHVVIQTEGREVPEGTLQRAAELAAYYSAGRHKNKCSVDYTLRKEVHRLRGGKPGQVVYKRHKTILVSPQE